ncbi:MAG TPA: TetR/AcrR family transcriptional regulator [Aldersonia sp.]
MAPGVKGSTYRQQQAMQTRERIADAARLLFARNGYSATSIDAIASEAGVAVRTVYTTFGAKREILSAICERWLEQARARERATETMAVPGTRDRLRAAAHWLANLYGCGFDVVTILDGAMGEDEPTREMLRAKLRGRNHVMDSFIESVDDDLRVPLADARAIYRAVAAPGVYRELVVETGWTTEAFEKWVGDILVEQLLGRP